MIVEDGTRDWPHADIYSITALEEVYVVIILDIVTYFDFRSVH